MPDQLSDPCRLTLTFDNGPSPAVTPQVLDILGQRQLPATFFVVGQQLRLPGGLELAEQVAAAGHRVGNHSMNHRIPLGDDPATDHPQSEIAAMQRLMGDLAGDDWLFRPFGGGGNLDQHLLSHAAVDHLVANDYTVVVWNSVPRDWIDTVTWPERARADMADLPWTVLVLHDLPTGAMDQLADFLDRAIDEGVEFRADYPDACVPVRGGVVQWPFEHLVAPVPAGQPG